MDLVVSLVDSDVDSAVLRPVQDSEKRTTTKDSLTSEKNRQSVYLSSSIFNLAWSNSEVKNPVLPVWTGSLEGIECCAVFCFNHVTCLSFTYDNVVCSLYQALRTQDIVVNGGGYSIFTAKNMAYHTFNDI